MLLEHVPKRLGKRRQLPLAAPQFLQQRAHGLGRGTIAAGTFNAPALDNQDRALFLEGADRLAHIGRLECFLSLNILNRETFPRLAGFPRRRDHPFNRGIFLKKQFADRGQRCDMRDGFSLHGDQRFSEQPFDGHAQLRRLQPS